MGRRNTQVEPNLHRKQRLNCSLGFDQLEQYPGWVLIGYSQTGRISQGSIVKSADWMVLHRPVELARLTGSW